MSKAATKQLFSYRQQVQELRADSTRAYDTSVLTVSSGGLVVSVTALGILIQTRVEPPITPFLLTWACFALASLAVVLSHLASRKTQGNTVAFVDEYLVEGRESDQELAQKIKDDPFNRWVDYLNATSAATVLIGVLFFLTALFMTIENAPLGADSTSGGGSGGESSQSDGGATRGHGSPPPPPSTSGGGGKGKGKGGK